MNIPDQIKIVERELALRRSCYPQWVKKGTMKQETSRHELAGMEAVLETLKACQYYEAIKPGSVRIELRGETLASKRYAVVKLIPDVNNDTLLISSTRDAALEFWRFYGRSG